MLARLMDAGKKFTAEIVSFEDEDLKKGSSGKLPHAATENMEIPFAVYLVEE